MAPQSINIIKNSTYLADKKMFFLVIKAWARNKQKVQKNNIPMSVTLGSICPNKRGKRVPGYHHQKAKKKSRLFKPNRQTKNRITVMVDKIIDHPKGETATLRAI
jgi:hypothetical protein